MAAWVEATREDDRALVVCGGDWRLPSLAALDAMLLEALERARQDRPARVRIDLQALTALDTAGCWLLVRSIRTVEAGGVAVDLLGGSTEHMSLIERLQAIEPEPIETAPIDHPLTRLVLRVGRSTIAIGKETARFLSFTGAISLAFLRLITAPRRLRLTAISHHVEQTGVNAIPIVALMAFLIGVVLAYQGADQLRRFGAEIFTINLLAVSTLRELGVLLTAIMVAGRSGSAFTAQIGTMKVNQELDAMEVIGLDHLDVLVVPRIIALLVALPLLTFLANIMALIGGGLVVIFVLDIPLIVFLRQLRDAVGLDLFVAGMVKAPVFAVLIAAVGCYMGLKVKNDAESVGLLTTQSVVFGIFLVIIVNAAFSVLFATFGL